MSPRTRDTATRMNAEDRRALVLAAATRCFAVGGYAGTTTDTIAREAAVSQPYVVRIFGSKLALFVEVFDLAMEQICAAFARVLEDGPFDPEGEDDWGRLGQAYTDLVADRDLLLVMMHGMTASGVPEIGDASRRWMAEVVELISSTGCTVEQTRDFIAQGMLINVLLAIGAPEHLRQEPRLEPLAVCLMGESLEQLTA